MAPTTVDQDVVVSLQYRLTLDDGSLVEETEAGDPLVYLHGHDNIIPGLETVLAGMGVGEERSVVVEAADAYGEYDPDDTDEFDRAEFPSDLKPEIGMMLSVRDQEGNDFTAQITQVTDEMITLDFNHPMAGKRLHFDVTVTDLRAASAEELEHGHAHDDHDHHH